MQLTESFAMTPAAAVSGIYLAHPQAKYFAVGRIGATRSPTTRRARAGDRGGGRAVADAKPVLTAALLALAVAGAAQANQIRLGKADQALARAAVVHRADLGGSGWRGGSKKPDLASGSVCVSYHPKDSDLVTTGAAETEWTNGALTFNSEVLLLKTATMVGADWHRSVRPSALVCLRSCSPASSARKHGSSPPRERGSPRSRATPRTSGSCSSCAPAGAGCASSSTSCWSAKAGPR